MMDDTYYSNSTATGADAAAMAVFGTATLGFFVVWTLMVVVTMVSMYKLFVKAGKPGWAALVPIYNIIVMFEITGRSPLLILLMFVPIANIYASVVYALDIAKAYGKDTGFGVLMVLLPIIALPMLAFSASTRYVGPVAQGKTFEP